MVFMPEMEDFLLNLNRRSVSMPFRDWWAVYETIFAILLLGLAQTIKAGSANPKITARLGYMPCLLGISKDALYLVLIGVHKHLFLRKLIG
jgi:hypothetical protein